MCWQRTTAIVAVLGVVCLAIGCAHDVRTEYPGRAPGMATGSVTIRFTHAVRGASVSVNGALVAEGEHTKKVTVTGVPAGDAEIQIAAGGNTQSRVEKVFTVLVEPYADTAIVVASPEMSTAYAIYMGLYQLGYFIFAGAIYVAIL
jgi:hypothetical protein